MRGLECPRGDHTGFRGNPISVATVKLATEFRVVAVRPSLLVMKQCLLLHALQVAQAWLLMQLQLGDPTKHDPRSGIPMSAVFTTKQQKTDWLLP